MLLTCHVRVFRMNPHYGATWMSRNSCSKQAQYLKFRWMEWESNLQPLFHKRTFLYGCFSRFLNCTNYTKLHKASHMHLIKLQIFYWLTRAYKKVLFIRTIQLLAGNEYPFHATSLFLYPQKISYCFQVVKKKTSVMKWVKFDHSFCWPLLSMS